MEAKVKVSYTAGGWPLISPGLGSRYIHFLVTANLLPPPRIHCNYSTAHFPRVHCAQFPRVQCGQSRDGGADSSIPGPGPGHQAQHGDYLYCQPIGTIGHTGAYAPMVHTSNVPGQTNFAHSLDSCISKQFFFLPFCPVVFYSAGL